MLSPEDKQQLLKRFPDVKLSYDRLLHKKVSADIHFIIPKGPKAFLWITHLHQRNIALVLTLDSRGSIRQIQSIVLAFSDKLAHGTLLYGTLFDHANSRCFCFEDMHWLQGRDVEDLALSDKIRCLYSLFQLTQTSRHSQLTLGVPVMETTYSLAVQRAHELPYRVHGIQAYMLRSRDGPIGTHLVKALSRLKAVFRVRATLQADIYELLCRSHDDECCHDVAMVQTYKKSVEMNSLFRTIKENQNLDLLEESDDEDEFENVSADKFVDLDKTLIMECLYVPKFRKWCPETVLTDPRLISEKKDILALEKK